MKTVFAGTPEFAVPALQALIDSRHSVAAVYTQPDRPAGRGRRPAASPVKQLAERHGIEVRQPQTLKDEAARGGLRALQPDLMVVVAYGLILPQAVLDTPREDEDVYLAFDQWLSALDGHNARAQQMITMLEARIERHQ